MKIASLLLALALLSAAAVHAESFVTIGDLKLYQVFAPPNSKEELLEYIPKGENLKEWKHLASVRVFKNLKEPTVYLQNVAVAVSKSHPSARYQFLKNDKTNELVLDFMTFPPDSVPNFYAEWNLMRAKYVEGRGLVVFQYAMRIYEVGPQTGAIVNAARNKMVAPFQAATFEQVEEPK